MTKVFLFRVSELERSRVGLVREDSDFEFNALKVYFIYRKGRNTESGRKMLNFLFLSFSLSLFFLQFNFDSFIHSPKNQQASSNGSRSSGKLNERHGYVEYD